jgi:hypothetical protein
LADAQQIDKQIANTRSRDEFFVKKVNMHLCAARLASLSSLSINTAPRAFD